MTRPRWQKVWTDLGGNPTRSLLVVASITVGLFAMGVIVILYAVVAQDLRGSYAAVNPANAYIQTDLYDPELVDSFTHVEGVRQAQGVRIVDLRARNRQAEWEAIRLVSYGDPEDLVMNRLHLVAGSWPPDDGQVVLEQHKLPKLGVGIGDRLVVERPSGKVRELVVTGVVQDLTLGAFSGGGGFFDAPAQGYVNAGTLELLEQPLPDWASGLYITVDPGGEPGAAQEAAWLRAVAARAADKLEKNHVQVLSSTVRSTKDHPNGYLVDAIVGVLFVLGLLVVFLSSFLITNTLQALLNQQVQQIGIMKTVGARRMQIAGVYVMLIFGFGALALAVAVPLSYQVAFKLLELLAGELNFVFQGARVVPAALVVQGILAFVMPQAAAWLPIWRGTHISVQEALSGILSAGQRRGKHRGEAEAAPARRRNRPRRLRLFSRPVLIALRNTFRRKGRLALTLITLTLGGAVFIATFNVQVSMSLYVDQIAQYFLSDVHVSLKRPYRTAVVESLLAEVPGVGKVEGWAAARAELVLEDGSAGERVQLLAPPAGSTLVEPILISGRWVKTEDENAIVLGELFQSRFPQLRVGDTLELRVNGKDTEWVVVGFFRLAGKNGGYSAYTSYDYLSRLVGQPARAATYQVVGERSGLTPADQARLSRAVEAQLEAHGIQVAGLNTGSALTGIAGEGFGILTLFLLFLAALTALVGSIGLAGTMSMNVMDRTREIGVMRAIGASDRVLMRMVLLEGMLIGALSYLLGAALSFPISKLMSDGISLAIFDAPSSFGFTFTGFGIWLGVVVVLSIAASILPARKAARLTIREVLSYE